MSVPRGPLRSKLRFIVSALVICTAMVLFFYGMPSLTAGPYGLHYIRQTDSLSFIAYFREYSTNLFTPGVLDLRNAPDSGQCAGEFPLIYWCIGMLERLLGPLPLLLKWTHLAVVLVGHAMLAGSLARLFNDHLLAAGLGLLLFSSGVVAYYACNFLPDAAAYGLVLIGWSIVLPALFNGVVTTNRWTMAAFVLAGLIKAPMTMHLILWCMLQYLHGTSRSESGARRVSRVLRSAGFVGLVAAWHLYARWYNAAHGSDYFLTSARPLWDLSSEESVVVTELVLSYWWTKYLHPSVWHVLALLCVVGALRYWRLAAPVRSGMALLMLATLAFVVLFYRKLADHDYYFLTVMPTVVWLFVVGLWSLLQLVEKRWWRWAVTILCWALSLSAANLARTEVARRMAHAPDGYSRTAISTSGLAGNRNVLDLPRDARIVVVGDSTTNGALLSTGRMGWSYPGFPVSGPVALDQVQRQGATHVLYLGTQEKLPVLAERIAAQDTWSLWRITE